MCSWQSDSLLFQLQQKRKKEREENLFGNDPDKSELSIVMAMFAIRTIAIFSVCVFYPSEQVSDRKNHTPHLIDRGHIFH